MATVNERLNREAIRHAVDLTHYTNNVTARMIAVLNRSDTRLAAELQAALDRLPAGSFTVERLDSLLKSVRKLNQAAFDAVAKELNNELRGFVAYEAGYQSQMLASALPIEVTVAAVSAEQVYTAAMNRPFQGRLLREVWPELEAGRMKAVRRAIAQGYVESKTTAQIIQEIRGTRTMGYADGLVNRSRREVEAVVRTAMGHYGGVTRDRFVAANSDLIKALMWSATLDLRTSSDCRLRDGLLYDPVTHEPMGHSVPWGGGPGRRHWNCVPGWQNVNLPSSVRRVYRRPYEGDLIIIRTAADREITCTPNHPILTPVGWVAAEALNLGSQVVCDGVGKGESGGDAKDDELPTSAKDIAEAFLVSSGVLTIEVPISTPDFHGDGAGSDVAVVGTDRGLLGDAEAALFEHVGKPVFQDGAPSILTEEGRSGGLDFGFKGYRGATHRLIGRLSKALSLISSHICHARELLFAAISGGYAGVFERKLNCGGGNAVMLCYASDPDATVKHGASIIDRKPSKFCAEPSGFRDASGANSCGVCSSSNSLRGRVEFSGNLGKGQAPIMSGLNFDGRGVDGSGSNLDSTVLQYRSDRGVGYVKPAGQIHDGCPSQVRLSNVGGDLLFTKAYLLEAASNLNARSAQGSSNGVVGHTKNAANAVDAFPFVVERGDSSVINRSSPFAHDASLMESAVDGADVDAILASDLLNGNSGSILFDDIISIERRDFCGHVYNFETADGWYTADGIVTHNCRSVSVPVTKSWRELGIPADELPPGTRASVDGQVPAETTYADWLKNQSAARQDEVLGRTRGRLLRQGDLPMDRMYDHKGRFLTLDQLRARDAAAFERAGL